MKEIKIPQEEAKIMMESIMSVTESLADVAQKLGNNDFSQTVNIHLTLLVDLCVFNLGGVIEFIKSNNLPIVPNKLLDDFLKQIAECYLDNSK